MKLRKMSISILFILFAITLIILPAKSYALDVAFCQIMRLGVRSDLGITVQLKDTATSNPAWGGAITQFYLHSDIKNTGYATLLQAYTMDKTVWVRIQDPGTSGSLITVVYIND